MKIFGLIGYPLEHSFSQSYFSEKFSKENLNNCLYKNFEIQDIYGLQKIITEFNPQGLNVTIPHKTTVLKFCDFISNEVKEIGAANTLSIKNDQISAYNTDWIGFTESLKKLQYDNSKTALILGSGGASKAIQYALKKLGVSFKIVSRNPYQGQLSYNQINETIMNSVSLIVNCSPLGTYPNIHLSPNIPYDYINSNHFCFDLVYNPERTLFLQKSEANGAGIKNGLEMLVLQAEEAWKIWQENL